MKISEKLIIEAVSKIFNVKGDELNSITKVNELNSVDYYKRLFKLKNIVEACFECDMVLDHRLLYEPVIDSMSIIELLKLHDLNKDTILFGISRLDLIYKERKVLADPFKCLQNSRVG